MRRVLATARAGEWWEYKLAPIAATGYATAAVAHVRPLAVAGRLALAVVALGIAAAFASVLNDLTDRAVDRRAGKPNRLEGRSARFCGVALAVPVVAGAGVAAVAWFHQPVILGLYGATYVAFVLYSVPPFRLKSRGAMGVVADATGEHLLPTVLAVAVVFDAAGRPLDLAWCTAVAGWALALGVREMTWHHAHRHPRAPGSVDGRGPHQPDRRGGTVPLGQPPSSGICVDVRQPALDEARRHPLSPCTGQHRAHVALEALQVAMHLRAPVSAMNRERLRYADKQTAARQS